MSLLLVTGIGTDIGKTYVACRLIEALRAQGRVVDALKPVVSGYDDETAAQSDPALLLQALGRAITAEELARVSPLRFKAALAANMAARAEGCVISFDAIVDMCRAGSGDPLIVEGAGGVMAPLDDVHTFLDLIAALGAPSILVSATYLGAISHTLTALAAMAAREHVPRCVIVNESEDGVDMDATLETLRALAPGVRFFAVRRGGSLSADAVAAITQA